MKKSGKQNITSASATFATEPVQHVASDVDSGAGRKLIVRAYSFQRATREYKRARQPSNDELSPMLRVGSIVNSEQEYKKP